MERDRQIDRQKAETDWERKRDLQCVRERDQEYDDDNLLLKLVFISAAISNPDLPIKCVISSEPPTRLL